MVFFFFTIKQLSHPTHTSLACWVSRRDLRPGVQSDKQPGTSCPCVWPPAKLRTLLSLTALPFVSPGRSFPFDCFIQGCAEKKVGSSEGFSWSLSYCVGHEANVCQLPKASTPNLNLGVEGMVSNVAPWICPALCESGF